MANETLSQYQQRMLRIWYLKPGTKRVLERSDENSRSDAGAVRSPTVRGKRRQ
jgi:hypothetical protein